MFKFANDLVIETLQELHNCFLRYAKQYETESPNPSRQGGRAAPFRFAVILVRSIGLHFGDRADLHARSFGEFVRAEHHACGQTSFPVERDEEFGRPVDHAGLAPEVGSATNVAQDLHEPLHLVEASHFGLQGREDVEARELRPLLREFGRNVASHDAHVLGLKSAVDVGRVARHVDEVSDAPGAAVDVRGNGGER